MLNGTVDMFAMTAHGIEYWVTQSFWERHISKLICLYRRTCILVHLCDGNQVAWSRLIGYTTDDEFAESAYTNRYSRTLSIL